MLSQSSGRPPLIHRLLINVRYGLELRLMYPLAVNQLAFQPPKGYVHETSGSPLIKGTRLKLFQNFEEPPQPCPTTPLATTAEEEPTSPAWDPSSRTPIVPSTRVDDHWALNAFLAYLNLRTVRGGKEMVLSPRVQDDNEMGLFRSFRGVWRDVEALGVQAKHPTARSSGLLVVIHAPPRVGTLVRPVRRRRHEGLQQWTVRVVKLQTDKADLITDEEYLIPESCLCEVEESSESKTLNDVQARLLKEPAAGH